MIADDEPKIRQGLKSVLEEMKLPITVCAEARNGMEALEKISTGFYSDGYLHA